MVLFEKLLINTQAVGIGTTSPQYLLDVNGNVRMSDTIQTTITKNLPAGNWGSYVDLCTISNAFCSLVYVDMTIVNNSNFQAGAKTYVIPITDYNFDFRPSTVYTRVFPKIATYNLYGPFDVDLEVRYDVSNLYIDGTSLTYFRLVKKLYTGSTSERTWNVSSSIKVFSTNVNYNNLYGIKIKQPISINTVTGSDSNYIASPFMPIVTSITETNRRVGIRTDDPGYTLDVIGQSRTSYIPELTQSQVSSNAFGYLIGWYTGDTWNSFLNQWNDISGSNNHITSTTGTVQKAAMTTGSKTNYIYGNTTASMQFPSGMLPANFTLFHVARYNGSTKGRIFTSPNTSPNWVSGFSNGMAGVAVQNGLNITPMTDIHGNNWVISTTAPNVFRSQGISRQTTTATSPYNVNLSINGLATEPSDWAVAEVLVFNGYVTDKITSIESYLINKYCGFTTGFSSSYVFQPISIVDINGVSLTTTNVNGVGIGTTLPLSSLHVYGNVNIGNNSKNYSSYQYQNIGNAVRLPTSIGTINGINLTSMNKRTRVSYGDALRCVKSWNTRVTGIAPNSSILNSVAWSGSLFVAVGNNGVVRTSPNGIVWTTRTSGTSSTLISVTWSGSLFVAVGASGTIITSANGTSWSPSTSGTGQTLNSVTWSGTVFVAVGGGGTILRSFNGTTSWNTVNNSGVGGNLNTIVWSPALSMFVASGTSGIIIGSADTSTWYGPSNTNSTPMSSIVWSSTLSMFVGVGSNGSNGIIMTSWTGTYWSYRRVIGSVVWSSELGLFAAIGETGLIETSPDGITWTIPSSGTTNALLSITWSPELTLFVASGESGTILTSSDGVTWTSRTSGTTNYLLSVVWSPELALFAITGGSGTILTSTNGTTWTSRTSGIVNSSPLTSITWSPELSLFTTVGDAGTVLTSPDGITWTSRTSGTTIALLSITWSPELVLLVLTTDAGGIITSPDGITWTSRTSGTTNPLTSVTWSPELSLFTVVGESNTILTSPNGITWTARTNSAGNIIAVCWSPELSLFVIVNTATSIYTSGYGVPSSLNTVNAVANQMTVIQNGNVGIGTTTPLSVLHIHETVGSVQSALTGSLRLSHSNVGGAQSIVFNSRSSGNDYGYVAYYSSTSNTVYNYFGATGTETCALVLGCENDSNNPTIGPDSVIITCAGNTVIDPKSGATYITGNVGIGTTNPKSRLDVYGNCAIGSAYAGITSAPANGLIVSGNVGIGSTTPTAALDVNGIVKTKLPAFSASMGTSSVTIPNSVEFLVPFSTVDFDTANCYTSNATNYKFTPNVAGYYQFNWGVNMGVNTTTGNMEFITMLFKNGARINLGTCFKHSGTFWDSSTGSALAYMNGTTDYVQVYAKQSSGGNATLNAYTQSTATHFSGYLARAT